MSTQKRTNDPLGEEGDEMATTAYRSLDFSKLLFSDKKISSKEALKDVIPMKWSDDVRNGVRKVTISTSSKEQVNE